MAPRRLCVAEVSNSDQVWGAEAAIMALAGPLAARGIDLVMASPAGGELEEQWTKMGLRHLPLEIGGRLGLRHPDLDTPAGAAQLAREMAVSAGSVARIARLARRVDLVASSSLWTHFDCAVAGRLARRPVVLDLHDIVRPGRGRILLGAAARLSSATVAVSQAVADCVGRTGGGRVRIMFPAVELDRFKPGRADPDMRRRLTASVNDPLVGIVGRVDPEKGIDLLVRAMAALEGPAARAHLVVVGSPAFDSGSYLARVRDEAARTLGDRARFVGRMEDVPEVLRALDILVNASVAEPFGLGVLEAEATGVPVVATRSGGVSDFLSDGDNALLVPCGDEHALARAIERLVADPGLRARLARRGRVVAETGHGIDLFSDRLAALYRELVSSPPRGGVGR